MERLMRLRGPATVGALVALGLQLVLVLGLALLSGAPIDVTGLPLAYYLADPALLVLLTALVIACWVREPAPQARRLTIAALVLTAATLALAAAMVIAGLVLLPAGGAVLVPLLVRLAPPLIAGIVAVGSFLTLLRRPLSIPASVPELPPAEPEPEPVDAQQQPGWTPDAAVGTVWRRAGDAASQTPSTSWDSPGRSEGGWGPITSPDTPAEPTRRAGE